MTSSVPIIDADAHVIETERTWDYLEPSDRKFRPRLYSTPDDPQPAVLGDRRQDRRISFLNVDRARAP